MWRSPSYVFLFKVASTSEIYPLSLHDALPICAARVQVRQSRARAPGKPADPDLDCVGRRRPVEDRKSTRLNSSHVKNSYAVFCLKKKTSRRDVISHRRRARADW